MVETDGTHIGVGGDGPEAVRLVPGHRGLGPETGEEGVGVTGVEGRVEEAGRQCRPGTDPFGVDAGHPMSLLPVSGSAKWGVRRSAMAATPSTKSGPFIMTSRRSAASSTEVAASRWRSR